MKTVAFHTLGCKVNTYETEAMRKLFEAKGYIGFGFSFDFTNGFKFGVGLGLGYEFSTNIDWYELFNW